jgi:hypothetical protein
MRAPTKFRTDPSTVSSKVIAFAGEGMACPQSLVIKFDTA